MQCETCHAGCCRAYSLFITIPDVLRISNDLGLSPEEFVDIKTYGESEGSSFVAKCPGILFSDASSEEQRFFITLRRVESLLIPNTIRCIFLNEWERSTPIEKRGDHPGAKIIARCSVYGSRPKMCGLYPSVLDAAGLLSYIRKPAISTLSKSNEIYKVCPEDWTAADFTNDAEKIVHDHTIDKYEWRFQAQVIEKWNESPRTKAEFFPLMKRLYKARTLATGERWSELFEETD